MTSDSAITVEFITTLAYNKISKEWYVLKMTEHARISLLDLRRGFTIVELMVVIIVLGILSAGVLGSTLGYQESARNRERANDIDAISRKLEQYYRTQSAATGATYPSSSTTSAILGTIVDDTDIIAAPRQTSNSIVVATNGSAQTPTISQYIYQPLNVDGTLCTTVPCARYKLYYRIEAGTGEVVVKNSLRQQ